VGCFFFSLNIVKVGMVTKRTFSSLTSLESHRPMEWSPLRLKMGPGGRSSLGGLIVTVFGCTGFLGRYVVNRLGKEGNQVIIPYRGEQDDYRHLRLMGDLGRIVPMKFHLKDEGSLRQTIRHSDVVINLIGQNNKSIHFSWDDVHVKGAERIARLCQEEGVSRLIHVSSLNAQLNSPSEFLRSKAEGELKVKEQYPNVTIIRPSVFYGHEDRFFNRIASFSNFPLGFPLYKSGQQRIRPVYVIDLVQAIYKIMSELTSHSLGKIYELYGPKEYTYRDIISYFEKVTYRKMRTFPAPSFLFEWIAESLHILPNFKISRDEVIRMGLHDQPTMLPVEEESSNEPSILTFKDLQIEPTPMEKVAIQFLRTYRNPTYFDEPLSDSDYYK
jgi:NADH dehydrogenase (ubiquinone) 1 alpha subcomplex subunit 9